MLLLGPQVRGAPLEEVARHHHMLGLLQRRLAGTYEQALLSTTYLCFTLHTWVAVRFGSVGSELKCMKVIQLGGCGRC